MPLNVPTDEKGGFEIARRSRGTPRIANRLLRRVRDYADVKADGRIGQALAHQALAMLDVDPLGLDVMDRKLLEAVIQRFDGGPVGLDNVTENDSSPSTWVSCRIGMLMTLKASPLVKVRRPPAAV